MFGKYKVGGSIEQYFKEISDSKMHYLCETWLRSESLLQVAVCVYNITGVGK